jgi:hypothetical protein
MNIQQQEQFYQMMGKLRGSRAASTRVTEVTNGLLVSKPANKEPEVIDLQEYVKSRKGVSAPGINKMKEIHDFIRSNGRL